MTTLAFFDAQELPLTLIEVENYLCSPPIHGLAPSNDLGPINRQATLNQINHTLKTELAARVGQSRGFYFLAGRDHLVASRIRRYRVSLLRLRSCRRYLLTLRHFPYLRAVALSGSLALLNSQPKSDIDLLIIVKKNRVWLARLFVSLYFQILRKRRYGAKIAGRFCLNHYLCEGIRIKEDRNLYTAVEYAALLPVLGSGRLRDFWAQNKWVRDFLPFAGFAAAGPFFGFETSRAARVFEKILDFTIGPFLNWASGVMQKARIRRQEHILVSDDELSFHPGSRGQRVLSKFLLTKAEFGL